MEELAESLLARYRGNGQSHPVEERVAPALDSIGWRAASDMPSDEVAPELAMVVASFARGHRDLRVLYGDVAECLRQHADHLDGSAASRSEWEPAAVKLIAE